MPDAKFADPRLARLLDAIEPDRRDLDAYEVMLAGLGARSVLDVGCGTGIFACRLARRGLAVTGVDPAGASVDIARRRPDGDQVQWVVGEAGDVPACGFDAATMTANVAMVFVTDEAWLGTLRAIHQRLRPGGHLIFEVRDPAREAWRGWARASTFGRTEVPGVGPVEHWCEVTSAAGALVSFRWTYRMLETGETLVSDSTLRFRSRQAVTGDLAESGFAIEGVGDAPDRPGLQFVFVASRRQGA